MKFKSCCIYLLLAFILLLYYCYLPTSKYLIVLLVPATLSLCYCLHLASHLSMELIFGVKKVSNLVNFFIEFLKFSHFYVYKINIWTLRSFLRSCWHPYCRISFRCSKTQISGLKHPAFWELFKLES